MPETGNPQDPTPDPYAQQPDPYGRQPDPQYAQGQYAQGQYGQGQYGQQPAGQYGQDPYAQGQHGQNPYGQPYGAPVPPAGYANWFQRVGAYLIDGLLTMVAALPLWIGYGMIAASTETMVNADGTTTTTSSAGGGALVLTLIGILTSLAFFIWNTCLKGGRTGYSIGKGALGIKLLKEQTGQPIGAGMAFLRYLCHILDGICYIGYLWPLWDKKRQTFADKIIGSIVVNQPKG